MQRGGLVFVLTACLLLPFISGSPPARSSPAPRLPPLGNRLLPHPLPGAGGPGPVTASGSLNALNATLVMPAGDQGSVSVQLEGTWTATVVFEITNSSGTWVGVQATNMGTAALVSSTTGNGIFLLPGGFSNVRVRASVFSSGPITVTMRGIPSGPGSVSVSAAVGAGGSVTVVDGGDVTQGATTDAAVQGDNAGTISAKLRGLNKSIATGIGITSLPALAAGTNSIGTVVQGTQNAAGTASWNVQGAGAAGSAVVGNPLLFAGTDGTNARSLLLNTDGTLDVGGFTANASPTFTRPANTTQYTANTAIANATSGAAQITFTNAARRSGGSGMIHSVWVLDEAAQTTKAQLELWLFDTTLATVINDDAAWTPVSADLAHLVGVVNLGSSPFLSTNDVVYDVTGLNMPFVCSGSANLFGQLVVRNTYTPVSGEVFVLRIQCSQD